MPVWMDTLIPEVIEELTSYLELPATKRKREIKQLAYKSFKWLTQYSAEDNAPNPPESATWKAEKLRRQLPKEVTGSKLQTLVAGFNEALNEHTRLYRDLKSEEYQQRVSARSERTVKIVFDPSEYIEKANKTLHETLINAKPKWENVSCAIALCTGRRMAEIHCSGEFEKTGEYELRFTGQLKQRTSKKNGQRTIVESFLIPTLVKADLILSGMNYLENVGRRLENPELVHSRLSRYFTTAIRNEWYVIPSDEWMKVDKVDRMTYHKLRPIYITCVLSAENYDPLDALTEVKKLLGDKTDKAAMSYNRLRLAEGAIVRA